MTVEAAHAICDRLETTIENESALRVAITSSRKPRPNIKGFVVL